jgi:hypothetical protein
MRHKLFFLLSLLPAVLSAQGSSRGVSSLKLPATSFVGATGESFIADPLALQSVRINPANIASRETYGISFSHTEWIQDVRTDYLSIAAPFHYGNVSLSIGNTSVNDIPIRGENPGPELGSFNSQSTFFQLTYAVEVTENIRIGIAPKYLYEKIYVDEATGWGIDIGALYTPPVNGLTLGLSITDIGSLSAFRYERTDLPSQIRFGGTYSFSLNEIILRTAAAFSSELGVSANHFSLGGEAVYKNTFAMRLGYKSGVDTYGFSFGVGIWYSIAVIDYAYVPFSKQIGNAHIISIGFTL